MTVPFNVFDPSDAFALCVRQQSEESWEHDIFDEVRTAFSTVEQFLIVVDETSEPPWKNEDIRRALEPTHRRQCLILSQVLTPFTMATVMMAVEQGFRVFVCSEDAADEFVNVTRLVQASATVLTVPQLVAELSLSQCIQSR